MDVLPTGQARPSRASGKLLPTSRASCQATLLDKVLSRQEGTIGVESKEIVIKEKYITAMVVKNM